MGESRVVFGHVVEALYKHTVADAMTASLQEALTREGIRPTEKFDAAYPHERWIRSVQLAAAAIYPELERAEAERRLGQAFIDGYGKTMLGSAVLAVLRLLGPKRTLGRMTKSFRSGTNYTETRLTEVGPDTWDLWMNEDAQLQPFTQGILEAALRVAGVTPQLEILEPTKMGCTYRTRW